MSDIIASEQKHGAFEMTIVRNTAGPLCASRFTPPSLESIMSTLRKNFAIALMIAMSGTMAHAQTKPAAKNIVIVHGALVDGSSWRAVYDILTKDGFHVTIVQEPLTSLAEDVDATKRVIDQQTGPIVLVGHSYGGSVITEGGPGPKGSAPGYCTPPQAHNGE